MIGLSGLRKRFGAVAVLDGGWEKWLREGRFE